ncbi:MAG: alanine--tRNA ligase, partial [Candidatus Hydrogenedentes bacterium]|nr:alanine--tRNA ligase [Candidatus Hydrogenedentota bacterium]
NGYTVDREGFESAMQRQREQARSAWTGSGEESLSPVYRVLHTELGDTKFTGYDTMHGTATIKAIVKKGQRVDSLALDEEGEIILDTTPFYAESGGQIGDTGYLDSVNGGAHITTTKAPVSKLICHFARVTKGTLKVGDAVDAQVDSAARTATMNHHTATHLLQAALQDILGDHVHQAGSLVTPERLRFDFTHFESIGAARLLDIERMVNQFIRTATPVTIRQMPLAEAKAAGAMALFGEKYADVVRVVTVGDISMELCGGTHVPNSGTIGYFKITSESSISAGVRRIEAVCGETAVDTLQARERSLQGTAQLLATTPDQLETRVNALLEENKRLQRELAKWKQQAAVGGQTDFMQQVKQVDGLQLLAVQMDGLDAEGLRGAMDKLREKLPSGVLVLGSANEGKASLCVGVSKDLTAKVKAGDIVKQLAPIVGGGGGGQPHLAQAGGKQPEKLPELIEKTPEVVKALIG